MVDHQNHAVRGGTVQGRPDLMYGHNTRGVKVWDESGNMTAYYGGLGDAVFAYDRGALDYQGDEAYGQSSHYAYSTGIEAGEVDHYILKPHTAWTGSRGVRTRFGEEKKDPKPDPGPRRMARRSAKFDALVQAYGVARAERNSREVRKLVDQMQKLLSRTLGRPTDRAQIVALADSLLEDSSFGRLYRSPPYHQLEQASSGDRGALQGRSGQSGYRGGRPTFGEDVQVYGADQARLQFGPMQYEGSPWGAAALGLAGLILLFQGPLRS